MITDKKRAEAVARVLAGESQASVCRDLKINANTMSRWVKKETSTMAKDGAISAGQGLTQEEPTKEEPKAKRHRRERVPLGQRDVLTYGKQDPNYVYRVVCEDDRRAGRTEVFKEAGWEPVRGFQQLGDDSADDSNPPGSVVGKPVGFGTVGYLMRKRKEEEEEDLAYVKDDANKLEEQIYRELEKPNRYGSIELGSRKESRR